MAKRTEVLARLTCPACGRLAPVGRTGMVRQHTAHAARCAGSGADVRAAARAWFARHDLTDELAAAEREHARRLKEYAPVKRRYDDAAARLAGLRERLRLLDEQARAEQRRRRDAPPPPPALPAFAVTLGLARWPSTRAEVVAAWRRYAFVTHPDGGGTAAAFVAVREAYEAALRQASP